MEGASEEAEQPRGRPYFREYKPGDCIVVHCVTWDSTTVSPAVIVSESAAKMYWSIPASFDSRNELFVRSFLSDSYEIVKKTDSTMFTKFHAQAGVNFEALRLKNEDMQAFRRAEAYAFSNQLPETWTPEHIYGEATPVEDSAEEPDADEVEERVDEREDESGVREAEYHRSQMVDDEEGEEEDMQEEGREANEGDDWSQWGNSGSVERTNSLASPLEDQTRRREVPTQTVRVKEEPRPVDDAEQQAEVIRAYDVRRLREKQADEQRRQQLLLEDKRRLEEEQERHRLNLEEQERLRWDQAFQLEANRQLQRQREAEEAERHRQQPHRRDERGGRSNQDELGSYRHRRESEDRHRRDDDGRNHHRHSEGKGSRQIGGDRQRREQGEGRRGQQEHGAIGRSPHASASSRPFPPAEVSRQRPPPGPPPVPARNWHIPEQIPYVPAAPFMPWPAPVYNFYIPSPQTPRYQPIPSHSSVVPGYMRGTQQGRHGPSQSASVVPPPASGTGQPPTYKRFY